MRHSSTTSALAVWALLTASSAGLAANFDWDGGGGNGDWATGGNWVGDTAPGNPSSDTLSFLDAGANTNYIGAAWTAGQVIVNNTNGEYLTDLGGYTYVGYETGGGTVIMVR